MCFKGNQCLSCLRHLSRFHINNIMMALYYRAYVESLWWFSLVSWTLVRKWSYLTADWWISAEPSPHYSRHLQQFTDSMFLDDSTYFCSLFLFPSSFLTKVSVPRMKNNNILKSFASFRSMNHSFVALWVTWCSKPDCIRWDRNSQLHHVLVILI